MSLKSKVVVITGASSGIGAGVAIRLAKLGCRLVLCGRNDTNLKKTATQCTEAGLPQDEVLCVVGDVTSVDDCKRIIDETIGHFGQLDVLVNNAGQLTPGSIYNMTLEQYDNTMNVNVRSVIVLTQLAVPHLEKTKGTIINVSSIAGIRSFPGILAYAMSKAALDQFTHCLALELADRGIRVNAVNPGVIVTEVHKRGGMSDADYEKFLEKCKTTHALGRPGNVEEVAGTIAFLASDDASFITGVTLPVDGGRGCMCPR
ncbi:3-oxoacyl-[acyl-carrier-protein] reductase FabG-like [Schistocerca serialis cubense]|uniref:3-oxoacyl-[acyl-carrier-protein] reductase FabG-like n=1 Tax=Schistocerca serialis cubense TaxID=2023355 RepID=UPI00214F2E71|nr:3-oxoacyl-[acyl-carrier-protein] reductase FabG-like [Schistocerca serialis cubense]